MKTTKKWLKTFLLMFALLLMPVMSAQADVATQQAGNTAVSKAYTGWIESRGYRYYYRNGVKLTGWQTIGGYRFYFNPYGRALTGWQKIGGYYYYFNTYGRALTGWQTLNGQKYYFYSNGRAATGTLTLNGVRYTFNERGRVLSSTSTNPVTRRAVVIGQTNYYPYASNLTACKYDAQAMASMLKKTGYSSVSTYYDAKASTMQSAISKFSSADSNDVSLFYYSGHGSSNGSLCSVDGYTISTSTLAGWLKKVPGTVIVILDSCFSGAVINKSADGTVTVKSAKEFNDNVISAFAKENTITKAGEMCTSKFQVLTACTKNQYSYAASSYSLFTNLLVKGVGFNYSGTKLSSAPADSNSDSKLSLYECWRYTYLGTNDQDAQYYPTSSTFTLFTR
ncbi:MAG: caspase family protein [Lachnospiraceae bacterium]|nr:caspase family protein [Lachnospiraceae bacterium]